MQRDLFLILNRLIIRSVNRLTYVTERAYYRFCRIDRRGRELKRKVTFFHCFYMLKPKKEIKFTNILRKMDSVRLYLVYTSPSLTGEAEIYFALIYDRLRFHSMWSIIWSFQISFQSLIKSLVLISFNTLRKHLLIKYELICKNYCFLLHWRHNIQRRTTALQYEYEYV